MLLKPENMLTERQNGIEDKQDGNQVDLTEMKTVIKVLHTTPPDNRQYHYLPIFKQVIISTSGQGATGQLPPKMDIVSSSISFYWKQDLVCITELSSTVCNTVRI